MKTIKKIITIIITAITLLALCGCDDGLPTKIGGGGKPQTYHPDTGRY